jgi:hypothetical protein
MSGVFQNIDPPPPHRPASVYPPAFGAGRGHTRWLERTIVLVWGGGGVFGRRQTLPCILYVYVSTWWSTTLILRLVESTEWEALEQAELITLLSSDELAADEPFIIHSIIRQVR